MTWVRCLIGQRHHRFDKISIAVSSEIKTALNRSVLLPRTNQQQMPNPRCHLALQRRYHNTLYPRRMQTHPLPLTQTIRCGILWGHPRFLRTLSGPFDNVFRTRIPAPRALCGGINAVISASTVFLIYVLYHALLCLSIEKCTFL